jgi:ABC-type polysaccharide/polyol phosphate export permease
MAKNYFSYGIHIFRQRYLNRYVETSLGKVWLVILPITPIILYNFLQQLGVFADSEIGVPKAVFISVGIHFYFTFTSALIEFSNSIVTNSHHLKTSDAKIKDIYLAIYLEVVTTFIIRTIFILGMLFYYDLLSVISVLAILMGGIASILLGSSFGIIASIICVFYRDVSNFISILSFYLLFASGVFAEIDSTNIFISSLQYSPVYFILNEMRSFALDSSTANFSGIFWISFIALLIFTFTFARVDSAKNTIYDYI